MIRCIAIILTIYIFSLLNAPAIGAIYRTISKNDCKKTCQSETTDQSCDKTECDFSFCCFKIQALVQKPFIEITRFRFENRKWVTFKEIYIYLRQKDIWKPPELID